MLCALLMLFGVGARGLWFSGVAFESRVVGLSGGAYRRRQLKRQWDAEWAS